ncbi:hypothetical protein D9V32_05110 [Mycetocola tolaasinivorans]|uniref:LPXTG cell wall anchor domain-containing protein n=1 Tax=Mycetocola tolaasinivorans TaxID=76635 RepID=A0A3L7A9D4_9MICO|nr:hypothetical protein [Mycetocola tolaasinivorans]RLP77006.1 hypothetical protein D9V32_05110 [Mycetocola tolaasinivorans]
MNRRSIVAALTGALAFAVLTPALPAFAADEIGLAWDGNSGYASQLDRPVFQTPRVVPGDSGQRSFVVRNQGESAGTLVAEIVNVRLTGNPEDEYYRDFTVNAYSAAELYGKDTRILTANLQKGASTTISLGYDFPVEATSGNYPSGSDSAVSVAFDVRLTISGSKVPDNPTSSPTPPVSPSPTPPVSPSPTPPVSPSATPTPSHTPGDPSEPPVAPPVTQPKPPILVHTGAGGWAMWVAIGGLLAATGLFIRRSAQRKNAENGS